jgi:DNA-binding NarL/FixJ family response regulator
MNSGADDPIRVLIVDDDPLVRAALQRMLTETEDITVVAEADDGDAVPAAIAQHRPHVVLMDLRMRRVDGVTATRALRALPEPPQVLVLTTFESDEDIRAALHAGSSGYLVKDAPPESIETAIREVHAGHPALSPSVARHLIDTINTHPSRSGADEASRRAEQRLSPLTCQERAVATAVARGHSNTRIAKDFHLGLSTVKTHISRAMAKLGLENRTQLALLVHDVDPAP